MLQKLRERMGREEGFTLIELLVVMLILGLLAAIAIPSFINQRGKAQDADAKADARTAQTAFETLATDNDGNYPLGDQRAALRTIEPTLSNVPDADFTATGVAGGYNIEVVSDSGRGFGINRAGGTFTYPCDNGGGCSGGTWD